MPGMDGSGPWGQGPATGRGRGFCVGGTPSGRGLGRGFGLGLGRGFCRVLFDDKEALLERKSLLEKSLEAIKRRLEDK